MFNENTAKQMERSTRMLSRNLLLFALSSVSLVVIMFVSIDPAILQDLYLNLKSQSTLMLYLEFSTGFSLGSVVFWACMSGFEMLMPSYCLKCETSIDRRARSQSLISRQSETFYKSSFLT